MAEVDIREINIVLEGASRLIEALRLELEKERRNRGQLEQALSDILNHPDASRGIRAIAQAALGL
jgi:hypothetical protein